MDKTFGYTFGAGLLIGAIFGWIAAGLVGLAPSSAGSSPPQLLSKGTTKEKKEITMNQTTKTILIILGSALVLCACASALLLGTGLWTFGRFVNWSAESVGNAPEVAVRVGSEIADFEVPAGFISPYGIHVGDLSIVGYESRSGKSHILFAQFPNGTHIDVEEMLRQIQEHSGEPRNEWYQTKTTIVEEKPVTIRGQPSTLSIAEGASSDGFTYRTASAIFQGRNGPALMMVASAIEEWDMNMVEDLLASIQ